RRGRFPSRSGREQLGGGLPLPKPGCAGKAGARRGTPIAHRTELAPGARRPPSRRSVRAAQPVTRKRAHGRPVARPHPTIRHGTGGFAMLNVRRAPCLVVLTLALSLLLAGAPTPARGQGGS